MRKALGITDVVTVSTVKEMIPSSSEVEAMDPPVVEAVVEAEVVMMITSAAEDEI